ncbi:MAG TPA: glycosyltransferase family 87 protein [Ktedonobacterales bacterium]|nr:glycosyltransferase family 87 protein [Ktedonobacterales bacterium]
MRPTGKRTDVGSSRPYVTTVAEAANRARSAAAPSLERARTLWRNPRVRLAVGLVAALVVLLSALRTAATPFTGGDLLYFTGRSHDLLTGRDPYAAALSGPRVTNGEYNDIFLYAPILYYLLAPLSLVRFATAWWIWSALNAGFLMGGCVAVVKLMRPQASLALGLVLAVAVTFTSMARFELYYGNVDVLLLCLLATAALAARGGKTLLAGVLLGLTPVVYLQALPIVLYYLWKREYRVVIIGAATFFAAEALGFLLAPAGTLGHFWSIITYFFGDWSAIYINQSLYGLLARWFRPMLYSAGPLLNLPWLPALGWLALAAVVLTLTGHRIARRPIAAGDSHRAGLELALAIAGLCLIFPVLEANTFILAGLPLIALALAVATTWSGATRRFQALGIALVIFFAVSTLGLTRLMARLSEQSGLHGFGLLALTIGAAPYLYLAAALFALICVALPEPKNAAI